MRCKFLASFFLLLSFSSKGAVSEDSSTVWGALGQDINLTIPNFPVTDIDEVRWESGATLVAEIKRKERRVFKPEFKIVTTETLQIKKVKRDGGNYTVTVYGMDGSSKLQKTFILKILERVSQPKISWECSNTTVTCRVKQGTDLNLTLYGGKHATSTHQKSLTYKWTNLNSPFKCSAKNKVSEEFTTAVVSCAEKGQHFYLIVGVSSGVLLLLILGALIIFCICKRKRQSRRRKGEELEIKAPRTSVMERSPKSHSTPAAASQNPMSSQPPPPGHHLQTPGHRPLPPSHRTREHQQKKRPPPSGTQTHQQKGPPLPRPRIQPKPPCRSGEDAPLPPPN